MADLLRAGGPLVVVEFAWDRIDEATAERAPERLPVASQTEKHSWLRRRCQEWAYGGTQKHGLPQSRTSPSGPARRGSTAPC